MNFHENTISFIRDHHSFKSCRVGMNLIKKLLKSIIKNEVLRHKGELNHFTNPIYLKLYVFKENMRLEP